MKDIYNSSRLYLKALLLALKYQKLLGEDFEANFLLTKEICQKVLEIAGIEVESFNEDNVPVDKSVMLYANHKNILDPLFILATINRSTSFVAKSSLFKYPIVKDFLTAIDCISLNRKETDAKKIIATQKEIISHLKYDRSLLIFPEGRRVGEDEIAKFKDASFRAPKQVDSYILPTYIDGTNHIFKKKTKLVFSPGLKKVTIIYGEPFKARELGFKNTKDISEYTQEQVLKLKREMV